MKKLLVPFICCHLLMIGLSPLIGARNLTKSELKRKTRTNAAGESLRRPQEGRVEVTTSSKGSAHYKNAFTQAATGQQVLTQEPNSEANSTDSGIEVIPALLPEEPIKPLHGEREIRHLSNIAPETLKELKDRPFSSQPQNQPSGSASALQTVESVPYEVEEDGAVKKSDASSLNPAVATPINPLAPTSLTSFAGVNNIDNAQLANGRINAPPDPDIAAGPNHVATVVNSLFTIYNKSGARLQNNNLSNWFNNVCPACNNFDPRIVYDPLSGRWAMMVLYKNEDTRDSKILLSVSQTSDPTGRWWNYALSGVLSYSGEDTWADYPDLSFDGIAPENGGAIYITTNQFRFSDGRFRTSMLFILPKSALYTGASLNYWRAWDRRNSDGSQPFTLRAAKTYGNAGAEFLINTQNVANYVSIWKVTPTYPPTPVEWTLQATLNIGGYTIPPNAKQLGTSDLLDANDNRMYNAVWRNNRIYAAFTEAHDWGGGGGNVAALRYVKINTSSNALEINQTYGADGFDYFCPAITTDSSENIVVVFARSSPSEYAGIRYTGRLTTDTSTQSSTQLKEGNTSLNKDSDKNYSRWGDYFGAAVDPTDSSKVWIYGEWAASLSGITRDFSWGTWVGQVQFGETTPTSTNLQYYPLPRPIRLLDTRTGAAACDAPGNPLAGGTIRTERARLTCNGITIPANAQAVVGNATVVNTTSGAGSGHVTLYPSNAALPTVSNLNYTPGQVVPNAFTVGLGGDGAFNIYVFSTLHFIVDITGYYAPSP